VEADPAAFAGLRLEVFLNEQNRGSQFGCNKLYNVFRSLDQVALKPVGLVSFPLLTQTRPKRGICATGLPQSRATGSPAPKAGVVTTSEPLPSVPVSFFADAIFRKCPDKFCRVWSVDHLCP
jgi:hypothetical protein